MTSWVPTRNDRGRTWACGAPLPGAAGGAVAILPSTGVREGEHRSVTESAEQERCSPSLRILTPAGGKGQLGADNRHIRAALMQIQFLRDVFNTLLGSDRGFLEAHHGIGDKIGVNAAYLAKPFPVGGNRIMAEQEMR